MEEKEAGEKALSIKKKKKKKKKKLSFSPSFAEMHGVTMMVLKS